MISIRSEQPGDEAAIRRLVTAAFPTPAEATLVERLRDSGRLTVSLVASDDAEIVGHVALSPVTVGDSPQSLGALGLAPLAVLPLYQRRGIGARLVGEAVAAARRGGCPLLVVLGDPAYYGRFGFMRAAAHGLENEYGADDAFMVLELRPGTLRQVSGLVRYAPEFASLAE